MNRIILVGEDHHNLLGLVRDFGVNGISPCGIIVGKEGYKGFVQKSKYWAKTWYVDSAEEAIELLKKFFCDKKEPAVLIASSDDVAAAFDVHYDELKDNFFLPGFRVQGRVFNLMNKEAQVNYAHKIGIEMLPSEIVELDSTFELSQYYPIILKPVASIEGEKTDIKICYNETEEMESINDLIKIGYRRLLRQLYLKERTEYVLTGAVMPVLHKCNFTLVKNVRQWPTCFGTGSFSEFVTEKTLLEFCNQVLEKVQNSGYSGLIDIEFFKTKDNKMYLNEVNWRSSGRNFVSLYTGVHSAYWWYCATIGKNYNDNCRISIKNGWTMNEMTDFRHIFKFKLSWFELLRDIKRTNSFAVWYCEDLQPFKARILGILKKIFRLSI